MSGCFFLKHGVYFWFACTVIVYCLFYWAVLLALKTYQFNPY